MGKKVEFRMERAGLIQAGDRVELKEDSISTMAGVMYYYTIKDAIAMSNNMKKRLEKKKGRVSSIEEKGSYWTVTVDMDE